VNARPLGTCSAYACMASIGLSRASNSWARLELIVRTMCPISPTFLYFSMLLAVVVFSCYLGSRAVSNPYEGRRVWKDAKSGNFWAKASVVASVALGALLLAFFGCMYL
jgi:hypothetical protein